MKYQLASSDKIEEYRAVANDWLVNENPSNMFVNCKNQAISAVMEYLANKDGCTLFASGANCNN